MPLTWQDSRIRPCGVSCSKHRCEQCHTVPIVQPQPPSGPSQSQTNPPSSSHVPVCRKNMERREELWQSCWWRAQIAGPRFNYVPLPAGNLGWHQQILGTWTTAFKHSCRSSQLLPPPAWHRALLCSMSTYPFPKGAQPWLRARATQ